MTFFTIFKFFKMYLYIHMLVDFDVRGQHGMVFFTGVSVIVDYGHPKIMVKRS